MLLIQKLKSLEKQIIFIRWINGEAFCKLQYVGNDFIEVSIIGPEMEYDENILIRPNLILEVIYGGNEIAKIIAEISGKMTIAE